MELVIRETGVKAVAAKLDRGLLFQHLPGGILRVHEKP
jgi:hypothetical protein